MGQIVQVSDPSQKPDHVKTGPTIQIPDTSGFRIPADIKLIFADFRPDHDASRHSRQRWINSCQT